MESDFGIYDFTKQIFSIYKQNLIGLPSFVRLVMLEVYEYCDYEAGTITITSLEKLARDHFQVDSERGRQKENINGDTLRNAFRTIKRFKSDYFKFTTVNQKIVIDMPFMRELYQSFSNEIGEVSTILASDVADAITLTQPDKSIDLPNKLTTDLAAASLDDAFNALADAPAKIKPKNNKTNKQAKKNESFMDLKKPIDRNFYPSAKTIELALEKGFVKVTSDIEIKRFVMYNEASLSRWADYNPVFLKWLEKDHNPSEFESTSSVQRHLRKNHGYAKCSTHQVTSIQSAIFDSNQRNLQIIADEEREREACGVIEGEYCEFVDVADIAV